MRQVKRCFVKTHKKLKPTTVCREVSTENVGATAVGQAPC